jgi:hypothetical protein
MSAGIGAFLPERGGRGTASATHPAAGTVVFLALAALFPLGIVDWSASAIDLSNLALGSAVLLIASWRLTGALTFGRNELIRGFFYVFVYINFGVAAMAQVVTGRFPLDNRTYDDLTIMRGYIVVLVGIAGYEIGWYLHSRRKARPGPARARHRSLSFSPTRAVLMGVAGLGLVAYQVATYGLTTFFTSREQSTSVLFGQGTDPGAPAWAVTDKAGGVLTAFLSQGPVFLALFVILYCRRYRHWPVARSIAADALWRLFIGALLVANVVMNNPIGNGRFWSMLVLASFLSVYAPYSRPRIVRMFVAGALLVFLFVFASLDLFRNTTDSVVLDVSGPSDTLVTNGTYAMFQMELNGVEYLDREDHTYGRQLGGSLLGFVPRSVWEGKPIATGQLIDGPLPRSATAWTELETDFGPVGVLLFFMAYGYGSSALTRHAALAHPGPVHALIPMIAVYQIALLRGSFLPILGAGYQVAVLVVVVLALRRPDDDPCGRTDARRAPSTEDAVPARVGGSPAPAAGITGGTGSVRS